MNESATPPPVTDADGLVAQFDTGIGSPGIDATDAVLVTGPWLAGSSSVIAALRDRLPGRVFVEAADLPSGEAPAAVVFVTSAVAPLTDSDCTLIDNAITHTDLVIGVVSKIDVHRNWRDVLGVNETKVAARSPRYRGVPWVGVAAAPDLGGPDIDGLVQLLEQRFTDDDLARQNRLRAWEFRLQSAVRRHRADGAGDDRAARVGALRDRRNETLRHRRLAKSERTIALRSQIQQARVQLTYFARSRCASVRAELQEDAGGMTRRLVPEFERYVRTRTQEVVVEVNDGVTAHLADVAQELGLAQSGAVPVPPVMDPPAPPLKSRRLETRLMMLLGAGFGLGLALTLSRLFADLAPGLTIAGLVAGGVVGLGVTVWVVGTRGLLHDRGVLDRWVTEVTTTLRSTVEQIVATRVLAAETALTAELAAAEDAATATAADRISEIDAELREHAVATARAAALRDRRLPNLRRALDAVQAELAETGGRDASEAVSVFPSADSQPRDE